MIHGHWPIKKPGSNAGLFLQIVRNAVYFATRSLAICVPICEKAAAIWLA